MILIMKSVSFIIDADGLDEPAFYGLQELLDSQITDAQAEIILYNYSNKETFKPGTPALQIVKSNQPGVSSLKKAIVSASGDFLVFTTTKNITVGFKEIIELAQDMKGLEVGVPIRLSEMERKLGLYRIKNCSFVLTNKSHALNNTDQELDLKNIIKTANSQLRLRFLNTSSSVGLYDSVVDRLIIYRPLLKLAKHRLREIQRMREDKREKARVIMLRDAVPDVPFSHDMPVFIICRDRIEPLKKLVAWLENEGLKNIVFIDNASTYPPLLEFLETTTYDVVRLNRNIGHTSPWSEGIVQAYAGGRPFIVTDPDVIPDDGAHGAIKRFCKLLSEHPERTKVGFGLKIDDLPDHYKLKDHVISWESQFWESTVEPDVYDAEIDTTFAVYRQNTPYTLGPGLRTGGKYVARHEPWYIDSSDPSGEVSYYRKHASRDIGTWGANADELTTIYRRHLSKESLS